MKYIIDFDARVEYDNEYLLLWPDKRPNDRLCFYMDDIRGASGWLPKDNTRVHVVFTREDGVYAVSMLPLEE